MLGFRCGTKAAQARPECTYSGPWTFYSSIEHYGVVVAPIDADPGSNSKCKLFLARNLGQVKLPSSLVVTFRWVL